MKPLLACIFAAFFVYFIETSQPDTTPSVTNTSAQPTTSQLSYQPPKCSYPTFTPKPSTYQPSVPMPVDFVAYDQKLPNRSYPEPPYYPSSVTPYHSYSSHRIPFQSPSYTQMPPDYNRMPHTSSYYEKVPQMPSSYHRAPHLFSYYNRRPYAYEQSSLSYPSYDQRHYPNMYYEQMSHSSMPYYERSQSYLSPSDRPHSLSISIQRLPSIPSSYNSRHLYSSDKAPHMPYMPTVDRTYEPTQKDRITFLNQNFPSLLKSPLHSYDLSQYYEKNYQRMPYLGSSYYGYPTYQIESPQRYPTWFSQDRYSARKLETNKEPIFLGKGSINMLPEGNVELVCSFANSSYQTVSVCLL